jgi:5-oxopent-3-ene-1,2,5-tricarboxylate decarboxylase/2-hydroxyhepta-2,4-diene-1,7-dioate isomerase
MKLAIFHGSIGNGVGIVADGGVLDYSRAYQVYRLIRDGVAVAPPDSLVDLMEQGLLDRRHLEGIREFVEKHNLAHDLMIPGEVRLAAPVSRPDKVIAMSTNYPFPGEPPPSQPTFFFKLGSTVIGPDEPIIHHQGIGRVDPEVELAVVMGKQAAFVPAERAFDYVAGYTVCNDVTARGRQTEDWNSGRLWTYTKNVDGFCPLGPYLVTPDEIPNPHDLRVTTRVNGEVRQDDNTANLVYKIPRLIEHISALLTLMPGDVISTGTPPGEDPINPGDVVEVEVERVGVLRNPVVAGR